MAVPGKPAARGQGASAPAPMSAAEKLMCEWEARHDVRARGGSLADPSAVQSYLSRARADERLHAREHPHHRGPARRQAGESSAGTGE